MPNDMDRSYSAWTGRKAAALKRTTLDCGHKQIDEVHFHLWCDRLSCSTECADAPHDCGEFKGKSGGEEEAVEPEVAPLLTLDDVASVAFELRQRSPEGRRTYLAEQRAQHVAMGAPTVWLEAFDAQAAALDDMAVLPDDLPGLRRAIERRRSGEQAVEALLGPAWARCPSVTLVPADDNRPSFTLADMEAASAAVRARRDAALEEVAEANVEVSARFADHLPPGYTVFFDREPLLPGEEEWAAANPSLGLPVTIAVEVSRDGTSAVAVRDSDGHVHLIDPAPPVDEHFTGQLNTFIEENDETLHRLSDEPDPAPRCCCGAAWIGWCGNPSGHPAAPVDELEEPDLDVQLVEMVEAPEDGDQHSWGSAVPYATGGIVETSGWVIVGEQGCDLSPPLPWWRRMLPGGTR